MHWHLFQYQNVNNRRKVPLNPDKIWANQCQWTHHGVTVKTPDRIWAPIMPQKVPGKICAFWKHQAAKNCNSWNFVSLPILLTKLRSVLVKYTNWDLYLHSIISREFMHSKAPHFHLLAAPRNLTNNDPSPDPTVEAAMDSPGAKLPATPWAAAKAADPIWPCRQINK